MNYTNTIIELLLFALGLSLVINATHIAFGKGMALNWLYEWLESKFRIVEYNLPVSQKTYLVDYREGDERFDSKYYISLCGRIKKSIYKREDETLIHYYYSKWNGKSLDMIYLEDKDKESSKYRNSEGLLYIAKPIYACASCMPSVWSLPLLTILVWWKVIFIAIFAVVISTILRDKLFE